MSVEQTLESLLKEFEMETGKSRQNVFSKLKTTVRERGFIFFIPSSGSKPEKK